MEQILIIEDDKALNQGRCRALQTENRELFSCRNIKTANIRLISGSLSLVILDINLPDGNGLDLLNEIKTTTP